MTYSLPFYIASTLTAARVVVEVQSGMYGDARCRAMHVTSGTEKEGWFSEALDVEFDDPAMLAWFLLRYPRDRKDRTLSKESWAPFGEIGLDEWPLHLSYINDLRKA